MKTFFLNISPVYNLDDLSSSNLVEIRSKLVKILQINNLFNLKHIYLNICHRNSPCGYVC